MQTNRIKLNNPECVIHGDYIKKILIYELKNQLIVILKGLNNV